MMAKQDNEIGDEFPREIGRPARRALVAAGYTRLEQLDGVSARDLAALHGVGPKAIRLLKSALAAQGLALANDKK